MKLQNFSGLPITVSSGTWTGTVPVGYVGTLHVTNAVTFSDGTNTVIATHESYETATISIGHGVALQQSEEMSDVASIFAGMALGLSILGVALILDTYRGITRYGGE